ncbi:hypothetical protein A6I89_01890 [Prescottella equi]|uniref:Putative tail fibre n=1 Tax=Rhodococcus phage REQ3 TaxID=1109714 RepID=G9FH79_9CAUD|nr:hypothetical protein [Prescottella equi]YP_005087224.1 tail protein [Rhodococcus phage REQ3]ERN43257.1 hypothetical protein H849_24349 [Prescottella equi NBRC 101255 = C 7]AEV51968.1 putative tail fibre [Rhodococcus phage REQ3]ORL29059.1 hypothetical protein A6I89_01890 [Prescottella equi]SUE04874.1 Uncharacterised protein [Prescottella equi]SUE19686.1 Uncharacterised protein [Prescottella equi]
MTIEISDGVTVTVNVPNRMPTICPAATPGGPITVPVQGGLTAEQFAHIAATVTAKVVEELGGQPGTVTWEAVQEKPTAFPPETHEHPIDEIDGLRTSLDGLASDVANRSEIGHRHNASDIDDLPSGGGGAGIDDATIGTDTTWSSQQITTDRAPGMWPVVDQSSGEVIAEVPILDGMNILYFLATGSIVWEVASGTARPNPSVKLVSSLPTFPSENQIYAVRGEGGIVTWHMPNIGG